MGFSKTGDTPHEITGDGFPRPINRGKPSPFPRMSGPATSNAANPDPAGRTTLPAETDGTAEAKKLPLDRHDPALRQDEFANRAGRLTDLRVQTHLAKRRPVCSPSSP